jgi:hypothetical protein
MNPTNLQPLSRRDWRAVAAEHLLLMRIIGSANIKSQIDAELDRRARRRPTHILTLPRCLTLQPAA